MGEEVQENSKEKSVESWGTERKHCIRSIGDVSISSDFSRTFHLEDMAL